MNKLYSLSLGETMRQSFIEDAQQYAYGEALFVVPGRYFSNLIKNQANVRTVMMDYLPNEILRINVKEQEYQRISRTGQEMLLEEIVADKLHNGELEYFAPLAGKQGFVKNLASFMGELARSGIEAGEMSRIMFAWDGRGRFREKDLELCSLYSTYRAKLEELNLYDIDGLYRLAINMLAQGQQRLPWKKLYFSEFYQFDKLQTELIKALSKNCDIEIGLFYDGQRGELSEATVNAYGDITGMDFQLAKIPPKISRPEDLTFLTNNWHKSTHGKIENKNISLLAATSTEREMQGVVTSIKNLLLGGIKTADIVVLVRSLTDYPGLSDLFRAYGVPTNLPQVINFAGEALPDFLSKLLITAVNSNKVEAWQALLATEYGQLLYKVNGSILEEAYNDKFFSTVTGFQNYVKNTFPENELDRLVILVKRLGKKQTGLEYVKVLSQLLLQEKISEQAGKAYQENKLSLKQIKILAGCEVLCQKVFESLEQAFTESGREEEKIAPEDFLALWQGECKDETISIEKGNPQGIQVLEAANVQGVTFPYVYLMGLREGVFPKIKFENWLYNDAERSELASLDIQLPQTVVNGTTDRYFFASALSMATAKLHLSYFADEEAGPSEYLEELEQYFTPDSWQPEKFVLTKDNCAGADDLLNIIAQAETLGPKEKKWLEGKAGKEFFLAKTLDKDRWNRQAVYNGKIAGEDELPYLSASSLDKYVKCPFSYLVDKEWKVAPWEPLTEEIQSTVSGNLYHMTLAKFLGRHLRENLSKLDEKKLEKELLKDFNSQYDFLVQTGNITETPLGEQEKKYYWLILANWLRAEITYQETAECNILPDKLEIGFGLADSKWPPLKLTFDGKETAFSGQIDRIDTDGANYFITDYKSGSFPNGSELEKGYALQLPLYVLALENICHVKEENIWGAGYYALRDSKRQSGMWNKEKKNLLPWLARTHNKEFSEVMSRALEYIGKCVLGIRKGEFPAQPLQKCPAYCPGYDICRYRLNLASNTDKEGNDNE